MKLRTVNLLRVSTDCLLHPSVKGKDDQYQDIIWFPKERRDEINKMVSDMYDPAGEYLELNKQEGVPF